MRESLGDSTADSTHRSGRKNIKPFSKLLLIGFVLLSQLAGTFSLQAQTAVDPADARVHSFLSKGINFDHIFFPYESDRVLTAAQWASIKDHLKESEFQQVAALGFTHVRLNLGRGFIQDLKPPYALRPEGLAYLDQAVGMALQNNLAIILDMHQTPAPDIFHDPQALEAYAVLWKSLAKHYADKPLSVLFEIMNEPAIAELRNPGPAEKDLDRWRVILKKLVASIRQSNPDRYIVVSGGGWGSAENLMEMGNLHLPKLIYSFHDYQPFIFTHQGAGWMGKPLSGLKGIHYPVPEDEVKKAWNAAQKAQEAVWPFQSIPRGFNREDMRQSLQPLWAFAQKEKLFLYCGEFGVHKPFAPAEDRARWITDMTDMFKENNVDWAMWAYHAGFDLVNEKGDPDQTIVKALGLKSER